GFQRLRRGARKHHDGHDGHRPQDQGLHRAGSRHQAGDRGCHREQDDSRGGKEANVGGAQRGAEIGPADRVSRQHRARQKVLRQDRRGAQLTAQSPSLEQRHAFWTSSSDVNRRKTHVPPPQRARRMDEPRHTYLDRDRSSFRVDHGFLRNAQVIRKRRQAKTGGSKMASTANRVLTTHVGSLVRPPQLVAFLHKIEDREPYDRSAYEACLKESIETVVRQQADAGIDIVSDGEFSKGRNWAFYFHDRLSGLATRPLTPDEAKDPMAAVGGGQDRVAFPE